MPWTVNEGDRGVAPAHAGGAGFDGDLALALNRVGVEKLGTGGERSRGDGACGLQKTVA